MSRNSIPNLEVQNVLVFRIADGMSHQMKKKLSYVLFFRFIHAMQMDEVQITRER